MVVNFSGTPTWTDICFSVELTALTVLDKLKEDIKPLPPSVEPITAVSFDALIVKSTGSNVVKNISLLVAEGTASPSEKTPASL